MPRATVLFRVTCTAPFILVQTEIATPLCTRQKLLDGFLSKIETHRQNYSYTLHHKFYIGSG